MRQANWPHRSLPDRWRPPSPVQPSLTNGLQDSTAPSLRPPSFPTSNFLGHPEKEHPTRPALPPLRATRSAILPRYDGASLPPVTLPPVRTPQPRRTTLVPSLRRPIAIAQLLSDPSPSPPRSQAASLALSRPPSSLSGSYSGSAAESQLPPHPFYGTLPPRGDLSLPALPFRQPPKVWPRDAAAPEKPRSDSVSNSAGPREQFKYSRSATSHASTPHHYDPLVETPSSIPVPLVSTAPALDYHLSVRQQPVAARACGFGERDRRVIDPPPILELKITDRETGEPAVDHNAMLALHCTLRSPNGNDDETEVLTAHSDMPSTRRLVGTLVASPYQAKDEHGVAGTFFVFPDLSCRSLGAYRLHLKLLRVDPLHMQPGAVHRSVASATTHAFTVYTAKDFPGMRASSALLKALRKQGLNVGVKRGSDARKGKRRAKSPSADSADEEDEPPPDFSDPDERAGSGDTAASGSTGGVSPKMIPLRKRSKRKR